MSIYTLSAALDQDGKRADHTVTLRPMSGRDMIALGAGELAELVPRLGAAVTSHDFTHAGEPADILDQPWETLARLLPHWRQATEEDALPQP